jgi:hypothetical protein
MKKCSAWKLGPNEMFILLNGIVTYFCVPPDGHMDYCLTFKPDAIAIEVGQAMVVNI